MGNKEIKSFELDQHELWVPEIVNNGVVVVKNILKKE